MADRYGTYRESAAVTNWISADVTLIPRNASAHIQPTSPSRRRDRKHADADQRRSDSTELSNTLDASAKSRLHRTRDDENARNNARIPQ